MSAVSPERRDYNRQFKVHSTLIALRSKLKISQQKMAENLGISRPAYQTYESCRALPPIETMLIIWEKYGISPNQLMGIKAGAYSPEIQISEFEKSYNSLPSDKKKIIDLIIKL